eukprot:6186862-Pleurochrysis_carterae.AAC.1
MWERRAICSQIPGKKLGYSSILLARDRRICPARASCSDGGKLAAPQMNRSARLARCEAEQHAT